MEIKASSLWYVLLTVKANAAFSDVENVRQVDKWMGR
jgi:hypothetical protein